MNQQGNDNLANIEQRVIKLEDHHKKCDDETLRALGTNLVIEALVKRAGDNLLV